MALCRLEQGARWERTELRQSPLTHGHLTDGRWGTGEPKEQDGFSNQGCCSLQLHKADREPNPTLASHTDIDSWETSMGKAGQSMGCVASIGFCPALCSHGLCFMVKTSYLHEFEPLYTFT